MIPLKKSLIRRSSCLKLVTEVTMPIKNFGITLDISAVLSRTAVFLLVPRAGIEPARGVKPRGILHVLPKFPYGVDYIFPPEADRALSEGLSLGLTF